MTEGDNGELAFGCPSCDYTQNEAFLECPACGVIVAKAVARQSGLYDPNQRTRSSTRADEERAPGANLSSAAWRALRLGGATALVVFAIPLSRFVFSYLIILIHELGHSLTSWLFGYPAIPTFDFLYGGGVSIQWQRSPALLGLVVVALGAMLWFFRRERRRLMITGTIVALFVIAAATAIHELLIVVMGHGAELLAVTVFYYRAFTGRRTRDALERMLYAACAVFVNLAVFVFGYRLMSSFLFQRQYEQAKGGGHWMDFSRLSDELGLSLTTIAGLFWLATLAPFVVAWLWHLNRDAIHERLGALWSESPSTGSR